MIIFLKTIGWVLLIMLKFMIVAISTALISSGVMWVCLEIFKQVSTNGDTNENEQVSTIGDTNER